MSESAGASGVQPEGETGPQAARRRARATQTKSAHVIVASAPCRDQQLALTLTLSGAGGEARGELLGLIATVGAGALDCLLTRAGERGCSGRRPVRGVCYARRVSRPSLSFVVLDTETTGLDPARDRIIELGALRLDEKLRETARFTSLVHADLPVPLAVSRMTGIGDADLRDAPPAAEVLAAFAAFAGPSLLVGHNAAFDRGHLEAAARRTGLLLLANDWFDTLEAALLLLPEHDRHALPLLSAAFGFGATSHRALPDAEATAGLLRRLAARAAGLAAEERRLLEAVRWPPLRLLDQIDAAPDEAPPPLVADEPDGAPAAPGSHPSLRGRRMARRVRRGDRALDAAPVTRGVTAAQPDDAGDAPHRGLAARLPGYRPRQGQLTMAEAVAAVLDRGGVGLFEAGTGMGKSLAYLLPAAFAGASTGGRVVVSTKTKALQRQLAAHELPLVADALPPGWRWAVLMGRENYLCRRRLDEAVQAESDALPDEARALALAYLVGRARRGEVDLSALPFRAQQELPALAELARELRSSRATCLGRHCPARRHCHWRLARARAEAAHLVCVNHALLLTGRETLPPFELVVVDEAHLLPSEATSAFSESVDWWTLELLARALRGPGRQRPLAARLKALARRAPADQALALRAAADAAERLLDDLPQLGRAIGEALVPIAQSAGETDDAARPRPAGRRSGSAAGRDYNLTAWLTPGLRETPSWDAFATAASVLAERLGAVAAAAADAAEALPDEHRERPALLTLAEDAGRAAALLRRAPRDARRRRGPVGRDRHGGERLVARRTRRAALDPDAHAADTRPRRARGPVGTPPRRGPHERHAHRRRLVRLLP